MQALIGLYVSLIIAGYKVAILLTILGALMEFVHRDAIRSVWI